MTWHSLRNLKFPIIKQLSTMKLSSSSFSCFSSSVTPVVKKVIHFLTHKEHPDFDGPKSKIARNFDWKIPNSKMKLKNDPFKYKNTFWPTRSVRIEIFILRNYLQNCPRIIYAFDHNFQNSKIKLKNYPLKSKKR